MLEQQSINRSPDAKTNNLGEILKIGNPDEEVVSVNF
jgi:hypothetical protein